MSRSDKEETLGETLKRVRLEKRLRLEEVHQKTKIPIKFLEAIEENQSPSMNPVYIKGLIKIYCNFLDLDYRSLLEKFPLETKGGSEKKENAMLLATPKFKVQRFLFIKTTVIILSIILLFMLGLFMLKTKTKKPPSLAQNYKTEAASHKTFLEWPKEKTISEVADKTIKVSLRANQDCWAKVTVDGKVVFQSILKKGRSGSWEAKESIKLSLGNAGGIELYVNDKPFSTLGRSGQIIRDLIIDPEGIKVIR
ncbi:MAG: DUF4115 domain-containing protein [Candidatus Omnitrophica bacterium]|nr:DUF4115 domain-containing protein [Candidatus Omnitrophota bacterium]